MRCKFNTRPASTRVLDARLRGKAIQARWDVPKYLKTEKGKWYEKEWKNLYETTDLSKLPNEPCACCRKGEGWCGWTSSKHAVKWKY